MWQGNNDSGSQILRAELKPGETLLWSGKPRGGIKFRTSDFFLIPFSLIWGGFAIFWEVMACAAFFGTGNFNHGQPAAFAIVFPLWGIPFVLVGLYFIFGRFIVDAKSRERTWYAVTDQRVIIITTLFGQKVRSLNLRQLSEIALDAKADNSGTITFGSPGPYSYMGDSSWPGAGRYGTPRFEMIDSVREVYDIIQTAQQGK